MVRKTLPVAALICALLFPAHAWAETWAWPLDASDSEPDADEVGPEAPDVEAAEIVPDTAPGGDDTIDASGECTEDWECEERHGEWYYCESGTCQGGDDMGADCEDDEDCEALYGEGYTCEFPYCTPVDPNRGGSSGGGESTDSGSSSGGGCTTGGAPLPQGLTLVALLGLLAIARRGRQLACA